MPVPGKNNRKHKNICWGLLNKRPLLLPKSLSNRLLEAGKELGEARGSTPNQFVALGLYAVQIRHKSLHSTLQRMQFSPWGRHWWALPSWDHGNHPCTWWGCLESAKKEKTEKMQSLCDCVGMGIHSTHIGHSQLQHWGRFAGGWGVDANTGQLEAQPHFFLEELENSNFTLPMSFYSDCLFSVLSQTLAERSRNILYGNVLLEYNHHFHTSWCFLRLGVAENDNWFLRVRTKYPSVYS